MHVSRRELRKPHLAKINPKLAVALRAMIHRGSRIDHAAQEAGLTAHRVRESLAQPHVQAFIRTEKQVRLEDVRCLNITELARIREGDGAAAVSAIKLLEEMAAPEAARMATVAAITPGVTINIISNQPQSDEGQHVQPMVIEHEPATASGSLVDRPSSQTKKSSVKKAGGKNPSRHARS